MSDIPHYESVEAARGALLDRDVREETVGDLMTAVKDAAPQLVDEYDVGDDVDVDEVAEWLQIGFAESCVQFIDEGVWQDGGENGVRRIIEDMEQNPISNATTVAGGMWRRSEDMVTLSGAMLAANHAQR